MTSNPQAAFFLQAFICYYVLCYPAEQHPVPPPPFCVHFIYLPLLIWLKLMITLLLVYTQQPRKILLEQLVRCMPPDDALPDHVIMVSGSDLQGCNLAGRLVERQQRAVCTGGAADVRATIACLVSKIQKL